MWCAVCAVRCAMCWMSPALDLTDPTLFWPAIFTSLVQLLWLFLIFYGMPAHLPAYAVPSQCDYFTANAPAGFCCTPATDPASCTYYASQPGAQPACTLQPDGIGCSSIKSPTWQSICGANATAACPLYDTTSAEYNTVGGCRRAAVGSRLQMHVQSSWAPHCVAAWLCQDPPLSLSPRHLLHPASLLPPLQLQSGWTSAQSNANRDISAMVFNTFIWCQVRWVRWVGGAASAPLCVFGLHARHLGADASH